MLLSFLMETFTDFPSSRPSFRSSTTFLDVLSTSLISVTFSPVLLLKVYSALSGSTFFSSSASVAASVSAASVVFASVAFSVTFSVAFASVAFSVTFSVASASVAFSASVEAPSAGASNLNGVAPLFASSAIRVIGATSNPRVLYSAVYPPSVVKEKVKDVLSVTVESFLIFRTVDAPSASPLFSSSATFPVSLRVNLISVTFSPVWL